MPNTNTAKADSNAELLAELERLRKENAELKKKAPLITFKVSPKGGVSVYGLGRFPVTLYRSQWEQLLDQKDAIMEFIAENAKNLTDKDAPKKPADSSSDSD